MKKDFRVYLDDIVDSCTKIAQYINGKDQKSFEEDTELQDAVIRRLEIIGEAIKRLPEDFRNQHLQITWRKAAGMRDVLIHAYDEVQYDQVWKTVAETLPPFKIQIQDLLKELETKQG